MVAVLEALKEWVEVRVVRLPFTAFLIAVLLTAVSVALLFLEYQNQQFSMRSIDNLDRGIVLTIFIFSFMAIWFILFLIHQDQASDVYSEVRKLLKGNWIVDYEANHGPVSKQVVVDTHSVGCDITINPENKKLEIRFGQGNNPVFANKSTQIINDVAIRYDNDGHYTMFYYYKDERKLSNAITSVLLPESANVDVADLEIEIFGRVRFEKPIAENLVTFMEGDWFDLNGNSCRLLALLDQIKASAVMNKPFTPIKLSEVPIHQRYFDAHMGRVVYHR